MWDLSFNWAIVSQPWEEMRSHWTTFLPRTGKTLKVHAQLLDIYLDLHRVEAASPQSSLSNERQWRQRNEYMFMEKCILWNIHFFIRQAQGQRRRLWFEFKKNKTFFFFSPNYLTGQILFLGGQFWPAGRQLPTPAIQYHDGLAVIFVNLC